MKRMYIKNLFVAVTLLTSSILMAQINVDPGMGTLEAAIATNGAETYILEAGGWYGLTSIIEINDPTVIKGVETDGMPAIIQIGNDNAGTIFPWMFRAFADLTLKNLFLTSQDLVGSPGPGVIELVSKSRLVIDNCVIDPAGTNTTVGGASSGSKLFFTNCEVYRNGHLDTPNDGGLFYGFAWDTLYVENNTFVSTGQDLVGTHFHAIPNNKFIWINHNTFFWHDVWIKKSYNDQNFYFTNNLLHDISLFAQFYEWGAFFPDYKLGNNMLSLACIDTLVTEGIAETLPSDRRFFWEYNLQYNSLPTLDLIRFAEDEHNTDLYFLPMLWDDDTPTDYVSKPIVSPADSSRENRILADDTNWPYMIYGNNMYDIDPGYNESRIYDLSDSAGMFLKGFYGDVFFGGDGDGKGHPSYYWNIDDWNDVPANYFPVTWPRFDGSYTNETLLSASIEKLPLGDLNWFPEKMAEWKNHQSAIMDHILALNETQYTAVGLKNINISEQFSVYPNPANDIIIVNSESALSQLKIYDLSGKMVKQIKLSGELHKEINIFNLKNGAYIIEAETLAGDSFSMKFLKN